MVLGNVQIVQNEQEWNETKDKLQSFTQDKPLLPYVGTLDWENTEEDGGEYATVDEYYYDINTNLGKTMLADGYKSVSKVLDGVTWYNVDKK